MIAPDLLSQLQAKAPKVWRNIWIVTNVDFRSPDGAPMLEEMREDYIQGEIQRACEKADLYINICRMWDKTYFASIGQKEEQFHCIRSIGEAYGSSACEALLLAFLAANEGQA